MPASAESRSCRAAKRSSATASRGRSTTRRSLAARGSIASPASRRRAPIGESLEETFVANLAFAAEATRGRRVKLLIEPINTRDMPGFFLNRSDEALRLMQRVGSDNLYLQADIYHMQVMEGDLARRLEAAMAAIAHIQIADNPGRHEPGSGEINYAFLLPLIDRLGYEGWVGCEYRPLTTTEAGLAWMAPEAFRR